MTSLRVFCCCCCVFLIVVFCEVPCDALSDPAQPETTLNPATKESLENVLFRDQSLEFCGYVSGEGQKKGEPCKRVFLLPGEMLRSSRKKSGLTDVI